MIRVLLVDDQPLVRAGLRLILEPEADIEIAGECADGDEVLAAVDRERPDVVVMDVRMRRVDGAEATRRLGAIDGSPPVLILTTFDDDETVAAALGAGAAGFILKDARGEDIVRATRAVAEGGSWLDAQVAGRVLETYRKVSGRNPGGGARLAALTERELDVLRQVGTGATNAEVATALYISEATVKTHLLRAFHKLGVSDRTAAVTKAMSLGLLDG